MTLPPDRKGSSIQKWMDSQMQKIRRDDDLILVITGDERSGKSTLAFLMATYMDPSFDPERQTTFSGNDFSRVATQLGKYRAVILDEAIRGGFSRDSPTQDNKQLAKFLTVCGERNLIGIICWPRLRWLDPILKEHRCRWNLHIQSRRRDDAIASLRLLRHGERVFDPPMEIFRFSFPPARGPAWEAYRRAKSNYVGDVGRGQDVEASLRSAILQQMRRIVKPIVRSLDVPSMH